MLMPVIVISVLAAFSIWCGVKLFLMGSELAELIRRYGVLVAVALGLISSLVLMLPAMLEHLEKAQILGIGILGVAAFCLLSFLFSIAREALLLPRKMKGREKPKVSTASFIAVDALDFASSLVGGALIGVAMVADFGASLIGLCAVVIFKILERSKAINRYESAVIAGSSISLNLIGSIVLVGVGVMSGYLVMGQFYAVASIVTGITLAYLVFLSGRGVWAFVKSLKK